MDNKIALKGPLGNAAGGITTSLTVSLRKRLLLRGSIRPMKSISGINSRYEDVDVVVIRENTEGDYCGLEHTVVPGITENITVASEAGLSHIAEVTFDYAAKANRQKVTAVFRKGIMKKTYSLFLECCRRVAKRYPDIQYQEMQVHTTCMLLLMDPKHFDVLVMPNIHGETVSSLCAGIIGGLSLVPSANIGKDYAVFEAMHGTAPELAGKNLANPTGLLMSACMMLHYLGLSDYGICISSALMKTLMEQKMLTPDMGGTATTFEFTDEVIKNLDNTCQNINH